MNAGALLAPRIVAVTAALTLAAFVGAGAAQRASSPRLREGRLPVQLPEAVGGGEVVLELTVASSGAVTRIDRIRATPPYTDLLVQSAATWHFEPATGVIEGRSVPVAAPVLVVALFRPPTFYAGPAPGASPQTLGASSPGLPQPKSLVMPAYPATALGGGLVLVEIELSRRAEPRGSRVVSPASGFDTAALDAVRAWRFDAPRAADAPDRLFVYAVVGFRAPVAPAAPQR